MTDHTHFIEYDQPKMGRQQRALCGRLVLTKSFALSPSCPDCQAVMVEDAETLKAIEANPEYGKHESQ